jgi:hypothetical protein
MLKIEPEAAESAEIAVVNWDDIHKWEAALRAVMLRANNIPFAVVEWHLRGYLSQCERSRDKLFKETP